MTLPTFVSAGLLANGTGAIAPAYGSHAAGDLVLLPVETGQEAVATPPGFTIAPTSPRTFSTSIRGSLFYDFTVGAAEGPASIADPGDHVNAFVAAFRGVHPTAPFHRINGTGYAGTTAVEFPAFMTEEDDCLIVWILMWAADSAGPLAGSEACASVAALTERFDAGSVDGNGGGIAMWTGTKAIAGEIVPLTVTMSTSTAYVAFAIALRPAPDAATIPISGTVTIAGSPAPNGGTVLIWDETLDELETSAVIAGGAGGWSCNVIHADHNYRAIYDDGSARGCSPEGTPPP